MRVKDLRLNDVMRICNGNVTCVECPLYCICYGRPYEWEEKDLDKEVPINATENN